MLKERHYILVLKKISKFTKWENLNGVVRKNNDDAVKIVLILTKCYIVFAIIVVTVYSLAPFLSANERFTPLDTYFSKYFDNTVFYIFFYVLQEIELLVTVTNFLRYDMLFTSVITNIIIEIRILKHRTKKISGDEHINELYNFVTHHNEILR